MLGEAEKKESTGEPRIVVTERSVRGVLASRSDVEPLFSVQVTARDALASFHRERGGGDVAELGETIQEAVGFLEYVSRFRPLSEPRRAGLCSLAGLWGWFDRQVDSIAQSTEPREKVREAIVAMHERLEARLQMERVEASRLTPQTRAIRGWCAYFAQPLNFKRYVESLELLGDGWRQMRPRGSRWPRTVAIGFRPSRALWRVKRMGEMASLALPTPMIAFTAVEFMPLLKMIHGEPGRNRSEVVAAMLRDEYQAIQAELDRLSGEYEPTKGRFHDLAMSFDRVNAAYFGGGLERPILGWTPGFRGRKFGHYEFARDRLAISARLDDPQVGTMVLDFVMYHELLHKVHGLRWKNGRGYAHTPEFHRDERRFAGHVEAEETLRRLAQEHRQRKRSRGC